MQNAIESALKPAAETAWSAEAGAHEVHFNIEREALGNEPGYSLREKSTFVLPR